MTKPQTNDTIEKIAALEPCPFCGGKAELVDQAVEYPERFTKKYVTCSAGCDASTALCTTIGAAYDAWNTRAESSELQALRQLVEKAKRIDFQDHSQISFSTVNGVWRWWGDRDVREGGSFVSNNGKGFPTALEAYKALKGEG